MSHSSGCQVTSTGAFLDLKQDRMRWAILITLVAVSGLVTGQSPSDEAAVYRVALAALAPTFSESVAVRLSESTTQAFSELWRQFEGEALKSMPRMHPRSRITYAKAETVEAFLQASSVAKPLPEELKALKGFASGTTGSQTASVSVSGIGFDQAGTQGLLYVNYLCGIACGHATFVLVERGDAGWRVAKIDQFTQY